VDARLTPAVTGRLGRDLRATAAEVSAALGTPGGRAAAPPVAAGRR